MKMNKETESIEKSVEKSLLPPSVGILVWLDKWCEKGLYS